MATATNLTQEEIELISAHTRLLEDKNNIIAKQQEEIAGLRAELLTWKRNAAAAARILDPKAAVSEAQTATLEDRTTTQMAASNGKVNLSDSFLLDKTPA